MAEFEPRKKNGSSRGSDQKSVEFPKVVGVSPIAECSQSDELRAKDARRFEFTLSCNWGFYDIYRTVSRHLFEVSVSEVCRAYVLTFGRYL